MKSFPDLIPIFPLSGVIYFPKTNLPLNIFEQRYIDLINDAYKNDKLIGMIQLKKDKEIFKVGCLGKINDFQKSPDGRILINLTGITRFEVLQEVKNSKLYREFKVDYKKYNLDLNPETKTIETEALIKKSKTFFKRNGLLLNWQEFEKLDKNQRINTLAMIAPITNEEKQKLLESTTLEDKIKNLENIIDFYLHEINLNNLTIQ
ncbi:LON peptidase substrate-binding domain-containing protein [Candidatus Pelagibacter bacterium]|nr:LON peptidase substrate-binding domain-containing protein [Candidatus Pelagibacter bacterium]MDA9624960.1 LON peptidase substrate-binding domain-containing protein [Candidatus Pelagibacter bacterium]